MPDLGLLLPTGLVGTTVYPFTITVDGLVISQLIDFPTMRLEETASEDANGVLSCRFWDSDNSRDVRAEMVVLVSDNTLGVDRFLGTVQRVWYEGGAVGRWVNFEAVESDNVLDRIMVPYESRPVEGTAARFGYFWGAYAKAPFSGDLTYVANVSASLPADTFQNLTLRQAIRQIAGQSGSAVHFYVDGAGRPHLFSGTESTPGAAPSNINVALAPGGGNIAPDDLRVERDGRIVNRVYVRGANAAGSGWFTDEASKATYGPREDFLDAPSADTAAKAQALALLYLGKTAEPNVRGSFTTGEPNNGWRAGQNVTITSDQDDLSAYATRIVKVTTTFTTGTGKRQYVVEFATTGANLSGMPTQSSVAIVGNVVEGTLGTDSNVSLGNDQTYITSSGVVVNDGAVDRVVLGALGGGDYGLRITNASSTVIIDGTSNMFKIAATGTLNLTGPNGSVAAGADSTAQVDLATGLTYAPAHHEQLEDATGVANALPTMSFDRSNGFPASGLVLDRWTVNTRVVSSNQTRVIATWASRLDRTATTYVVRYYVFKEAGI